LRHTADGEGGKERATLMRNQPWGKKKQNGRSVRKKNKKTTG